MSLYSLDGITPRIAATAWVAPGAVVIGDVEIGDEATIWFGCILRGDTNLIRVGARSNIQDGSVLHVNLGEGMECLIGTDVTVGHKAIIHAARLEDGAFVGMGAIVLDQAVIEGGGALAAGAVLSPGKRIPAGELWAGTPAKKIRDVTEQDRMRFDLTAKIYVRNGQRFRAGLAPLGG